jgi:hypothetical protein
VAAESPLNSVLQICVTIGMRLVWGVLPLSPGESGLSALRAVIYKFAKYWAAFKLADTHFTAAFCDDLDFFESAINKHVLGIDSGRGTRAQPWRRFSGWCRFIEASQGSLGIQL